MEAANRTSTPPRPASVGRIVASNALFWLTLCLVGASGSYSDALRNHDDIAFAHLFQGWCWDHVPVCLLGIALHLVQRRRPDCFATGARIAAGYGLALALFLPGSLLFIAAHHLLATGHGLAPQSIWLRVLAMQRYTWFVELAWTSGTYVGVVALCLWRLQRERERAWQQAERDNLGLRLALEERNLQLLRGQLEPHFMFNALNAISALVRSDDRALALAGIKRLSDLLRYALAASEREWVLLAEELQFVRDYLDLQSLRYGPRLRVVIDGDSADALGAECPPLLLQPLVENALRHGLERDGGAGEVRISFVAREREVLVRIANPLVTDAPPNPGAGIGLANARARLQTAYGPRALLQAAPHDGEFVVELRLPQDAQDGPDAPDAAARLAMAAS